MAIAAMATVRAPIPSPSSSVSKISPVPRISTISAAFGDGESIGQSDPVTATIYGRRQLLKGLALAPLLRGAAPATPPSVAKGVEVGWYLPLSPSDPSFVFVKNSSRQALGAGSGKNGTEKNKKSRRPGHFW